MLILIRHWSRSINQFQLNIYLRDTLYKLEWWRWWQWWSFIYGLRITWYRQFLIQFILCKVNALSTLHKCSNSYWESHATLQDWCLTFNCMINALLSWSSIIGYHYCTLDFAYFLHALTFCMHQAFCRRRPWGKSYLASSSSSSSLSLYIYIHIWLRGIGLLSKWEVWTIAPTQAQPIPYLYKFLLRTFICVFFTNICSWVRYVLYFYVFKYL